MKTRNLILPLIFACGSASADLLEISSKSQDAATVLAEVAVIRDKNIPLRLIDRATCVATIPKAIRAGFILGGRYGKGLVSCRVGSEWSNPSFLEIRGGSWGWQFGFESVDLVLVFTKSNAIDKFSNTNFTLGADATVAAGPVGRDAQAGTDYKFNSEIYSYSRARGLFAGITVEGTVISVDHQTNGEIYGYVSAKDLLTTDGTAAPTQVLPYVHALKLLSQ